MNKNYAFGIFVAILIAVFCKTDALFAQSSVTETWKGITVLPLYENDPIGVPGDMTISLTYRGGKLHGTITGAPFSGEELYDIKSETKKFTASVWYRFAMKTARANLLLVRQDPWMYGVIKLSVKIGAVDYIKVYLKRQ